MTNIFSTPEAEAWCRGFGYDDYLSLCERISHNPVAQRVYSTLCAAFEAQYEEDIRDVVGGDSVDDFFVEDLG